MASDSEDNDYGSDSDENDEYDSAPPKKRRRHDASMFIDREVEESDESEEEYDSHDYRETTTTPIPQRGPNFANMSDEQLSQIGSRYEHYNSDDDEEDDDAPGPDLRRAHPTTNDPRIFKVTCRRPGEEKTLVMAIMDRFASRACARKPLAACSAFCLDHVKGYIFVEAKNSMDVRQAIEGLLFTPKSPIGLKPEAIKIKDMISVLKIPKKVTVLDTGSWVRVKRGLYAGDLAMVQRYDESKGKAWIKLIPRLDFSEKRPGEQEDEAGSKRKRKTRPPAIFFNRDSVPVNYQVQENMRDSQFGDMFFDVLKGKGKKFHEGYLFKEVFVKSLDITNVSPSIEEVKKFQGSTSAEQVIQSIGRAKTTKKQKISRGDKIIVLHGALANVQAKVEQVGEDEVIATPCGFAEFKEPISIEINNIRKLFQKGDNVQVISGNHKGEAGLIVNIEDNEVVTIYSHDTRETIKVLIADVQQSSVKQGVRVALKNYRLHDLVTVGQNSAGMIVKVNADSFTVLDTTGEVKRVALSDMGMKRSSHVSFDKAGNQITARDEVTVVEGPNKGKEGTVKYVYRHHLFIEAPGYLENGGFFVVRSNTTVASGRQMAARPFNPTEPRSPYIDHNGNSRGRGGPRGTRGRGRGGGGRGGRKDPMIAKKVKIIRGTFRGYDAMVREANASSYRVELLARSKILSVPREDVTEIQARNDFSTLTSGKTPALGDRTPMMGDRTPMMGDRTPMVGDRTPMVERSPNPYDRNPGSDMSTPYDSWGRDTDYSHVATPKNFETVSPYAQIGTPMNYPTTPGSYSIDTPYGQVANSPYNVVPTPQAYPSTPATPGMMNPQTPAYGDYDMVDDSAESLPAGIEVRISDSYSGGGFPGNVGIIQYSGSTASVKLHNSGQTTYVPSRHLEVVVPAKNDHVLIFRGNYSGTEGTLAQLMNNEAVVQTADDEFLTLEISNVAKYFPGYS